MERVSRLSEQQPYLRVVKHPNPEAIHIVLPNVTLLVQEGAPKGVLVSGEEIEI